MFRRLFGRGASAGGTGNNKQQEPEPPPSSTIAGLASDRPEADPDKDQLGYKSFARHLAESILSMVPQEGLVIGIYGPWGAGKTTLVNFVRHYLDQADEGVRPIIVEFNPWWFSGAEDLTRRFFVQLLEELGQQPFMSNELREAVADLGGIVSKIPVAPVAVVGQAASLLRPKAGDIVKAKARVAKALARQSRKLLIVLDDIDRLSADEIRELFRLVKSVGDLPNVIYLLSFDRGAVTAALNRFQEARGEAYLEKIVQVPFELPLPDKTDLRRLLTSKLDQILGDMAPGLFDEGRWRELFLQGLDPFVETPRDVVRLTNTLSVTYPAVKGEVNPVDFIGVEGLRVFLPQLYDVVRRNRAEFAGREGRGIFETSTHEAKPFHDAWFKDVPSAHQTIARALVTQLFPKVAAVWGSGGHTGDRESRWRSELRVCSPDIFPVYFRLAVPAGGATAAELRALIALADNHDAFAARLVDLAGERQTTGESRARAFLERLVDYARDDDVPAASIPSMLRAIFDAADSLLLPEDEPTGLFGFGNRTLIGQMAYALLRRLSEPERFHVLAELVRSAGSIGVLVAQLAILGQEHGKHTSSGGVPAEERQVTSEHLAELEQAAVQRIRDTIAPDPFALLDRPLLAAVLYRWRDWASQAEVRDWVTAVLADDHAILRLLDEFLMQGWSSAEGRTYTLDTGLADFLDPASIVDRVRVLVTRADATERQRIAMRQFLEAFGGLSDQSEWQSSKLVSNGLTK